MICTLIHLYNRAYKDLTGRFPTSGNEYVLIAHHVYFNVILGLPIKNRQAPTIKNTCVKLNGQSKSSKW